MKIKPTQNNDSSWDLSKQSKEWKIRYIKIKCKNDVQWVSNWFVEYIDGYHDWNRCFQPPPIETWLKHRGIKLKTSDDLMDNFKNKNQGAGHFLEHLEDCRYFHEMNDIEHDRKLGVKFPICVK